MLLNSGDIIYLNSHYNGTLNTNIGYELMSDVNSITDINNSCYIFDFCDGLVRIYIKHIAFDKIREIKINKINNN